MSRLTRKSDPLGYVKNKHLEVEGLLFYGKEGGSSQVLFTAPFPTHVHNCEVNLNYVCTGKTLPIPPASCPPWAG